MSLKPKYSGYLSKAFWERVAEVDGEKPGAYAMGVILQEVELHVLQYLSNDTGIAIWAGTDSNSPNRA